MSTKLSSQRTPLRQFFNSLDLSDDQETYAGSAVKAALEWRSGLTIEQIDDTVLTAEHPAWRSYVRSSCGNQGEGRSAEPRRNLRTRLGTRDRALGGAAATPRH